MARPSTEPPAGVEINGARLRELRKLAGDDLKSFADRAGITFQYLSQLERGVRRWATPPVFVRICDALGVTDRRHLVLSTNTDTGQVDPWPTCPCRTCPYAAGNPAPGSRVSPRR